jgi:hypothetical protein
MAMRVGAWGIVAPILVTVASMGTRCGISHEEEVGDEGQLQIEIELRVGEKAKGPGDGVRVEVEAVG